MVAQNGLLADVHEKESTGAIGVLCFSFIEAGLAEKRRLLVSAGSCDLDGTAEDVRHGLAIYTG